MKQAENKSYPEVTITGNGGPFLRRKCSIYGTGIIIESNRFLFAEEYLTGKLETEAPPVATTTISGYYFARGCKIFNSHREIDRLRFLQQNLLFHTN